MDALRQLRNIWVIGADNDPCVIRLLHMKPTEVTAIVGQNGPARRGSDLEDVGVICPSAGQSSIARRQDIVAELA